MAFWVTTSFRCMDGMELRRHWPDGEEDGVEEGAQTGAGVVR